MMMQRQENKDQCCLQHIPRRSHPLNLNMERSFQSDVWIMPCCLSGGFFFGGFSGLRWSSLLGLMC